jgi:hypothetical protein
MRSMILPLVILGTLSVAACTIQDNDKDQDSDDNGGAGRGASSGQGGAGSGGVSGVGGAGTGGSGTGGTGTSGTGGGAMPGAKGWTAMPLVDDKRTENTVFHSGNDMVTGIYFNSLNEGFVATTGSNQTFSQGGALFRATQKQVTDIAIGGDGLVKCLLGSLNFVGVEKTSKGYVARAHACELIASEDGGKSFVVQAVGVGDPFGIERVLAFRETGSGALLVRDSGVVSVTTAAPGPNAIWDDTWAPEGAPPTPNPLPADQCQGRPDGPLNPPLSTSVYVSADAKFIAYTSSPNDNPQICISNDGGKSFYPKVLPGVAADVLFAAPMGVTFANDTTGITWYANNIYPGATYIYRTTDSGNTWAKVDVPTDIAGKDVELNTGFFAPDGQHGWIVGYNFSNKIALMLKTSDGGATWSTASGDLAAKVSEAGGDKLRAGFALDAYHLWVGGDRGILMANEAGGELASGERPKGGPPGSAR